MKHTVSLALGAIALAVAFVAVPAVSPAQPAPTFTPVPATKPDFSSMMFMTGTWTCTQMLRGKSRPDTSTTTVGLDGTWLISQDTAPPFDQYRTYTITGTNYMTYDPTVKQWVLTGVDSTGGYLMQSSPGWNGSTMTWTGKALDGTTATDVITKVSDTETSDANIVTDPSGKATPTTITCKKSSS
ncbi:MAG TPA: hypothetical protein VHX17_11635 [Candidatus Cybelea sp.]|jgi:hypothetical protein|nr:hypothetical protein [Candidatus Cybelea sp.]